MRHGKKFNHLGRKVGHRKAMLRNMASSLILHKRIKTTVAKAKALRQYVEPVITASKNNEVKEDKMNASRLAFRYLQDKTAVKALFEEVSEKVANRNGGYTRIIKLGKRLGDNAEMALIELVDFNDLYTQGKASATAFKRKRRRKSKAANVEGETAIEAQSDELANNEIEATSDQDGETNEEDKKED